MVIILHEKLNEFKLLKECDINERKPIYNELLNLSYEHAPVRMVAFTNSPLVKVISVDMWDMTPSIGYNWGFENVYYGNGLRNHCSCAM